MKTPSSRETEREQHPVRYGLSVPQRFVFQSRFESVPQSVTKVQEPAQIVLVGVLLHHIDLGLRGSRHDRRESRRFTCQDLIQPTLEILEEILVQNHRNLHDLEETRTQLGGR